MITIRAMTAGDVDPVMRLEARTPEAPHWDRKAYEQFLTRDTKDIYSGAWVAEDGSELAGFVMARLVVDVCELESIVVAEISRGSGTGWALLETLSTWAAEHGAKRLELEVRAGNEIAIRFYERAGLVRQGVRRGYYRDPDEDAVLMGKSLHSID